MLYPLSYGGMTPWELRHHWKSSEVASKAYRARVRDPRPPAGW